MTTQDITQWESLSEQHHNDICRNPPLTPEQIDLLWEKLTERQRDLVCQNQKITTAQINSLWEKLTEWQRNYVCQNQKLSHTQIDLWWKKLTEEQRNYVCWNQKLTTAQIDHGWEKLTERQRNRVCRYQKMTTAQIDHVWKECNEEQRNYICRYQQMTTAQVSLWWEELTEVQRKYIKDIHQDYPIIKAQIIAGKDYATQHDLEVDELGFFGYRNHDQHGRGMFNRTIFYDHPGEYRDWRCDPRANKENSFGLGIWPVGNTKVYVKFEDFVVAVDRKDGKARVEAFALLET